MQQAAKLLPPLHVAAGAQMTGFCLDQLVF
jgi:hypothetical protein